MTRVGSTEIMAQRGHWLKDSSCLLLPRYTDVGPRPPGIITTLTCPSSLIYSRRLIFWVSLRILNLCCQKRTPKSTALADAR